MTMMTILIVLLFIMILILVTMMIMLIDNPDTYTNRAVTRRARIISFGWGWGPLV